MVNKENNEQEINMSLDEFYSGIIEAEKLIYEMDGTRTSHYEFDSDGQSPVVIDKNLDIVMIPEMPVDEKFLYTNGFAKNGLAVVEDENNIFKFINTDGFVKLELPESISADGFHENPNITVIREKNKVGVMTINSSITSKCPFKEVMISRFSDCHMVKKGTNWYILDSNMSLIEALSFKKPTVINKQGYFVAKIDENSDTKRYIEDFSKSSFYVCRIKDGNIGVAYPLTSVKSVDISEDEPLLILTYAGGAKVLHYIETAENNNGVISSFFSPYVDGEAIVNLPTEIIANIIVTNAIESGKLLEE